MNRGWTLLGALGVSGAVAGVVAWIMSRRSAEDVGAGSSGLLEELGLKRSAQDILDAVATVDPEHNPELQPGAPPASADGTWCNKAAVWIADELGVSLPWGDWGTRANDIISWIDAGNDGWYPIQESEATAAAMAGNLVLATYYNFAGPGHIAVVLPIPGAVPQIAQAGRHNFNQAPVNSPQTFGRIKPIYYAHA